jgi:putative addiction module killer protein
MEVRHYLTESGRDPYQEWLDRLKDIQARIAIQRRIDRLLSGNFGDHKFCRDGIWELRIDTGPGYRVYYAKINQTIVLLLCGGNKRSQNSDINRAVKYWDNYQQRML